MKLIRRGSEYVSSAIRGTGPRLVAGKDVFARAADERAARVQRRRREHQVRGARRGAHGGAFHDDAAVEPVLAHGLLEALGIGLERLEAMHRAGRPHRDCHVHGEQPDVGAGVDDVLPGAHRAADELDLVQLEAAAQDVEPDGVIGEIDDQAQPRLDFLDDQGARVHLRVIPVLLRYSSDVTMSLRRSRVSWYPRIFGRMTSSLSGSRSSRIRHAQTMWSRVRPTSVSVPPLATAARHQFLGLGRTPGAGGVVGEVARRQGLPDVEDRLHDRPAGFDHVGALEQRGVADHAVVEQPLVAGARRRRSSRRSRSPC